jgi:hypothetical protein
MPVLNVCNLKPEYFAAIARGRKSTEWRWRRRPDARLEAVAIGEPIALLEIGSDRCLRATVRAVVRFDYPDHCLYAIRLLKPRLTSAPRGAQDPGLASAGEALSPGPIRLTGMPGFSGSLLRTSGHLAGK